MWMRRQSWRTSIRIRASYLKDLSGGHPECPHILETPPETSMTPSRNVLVLMNLFSSTWKTWWWVNRWQHKCFQTGRNVIPRRGGEVHFAKREGHRPASHMTCLTAITQPCCGEWPNESSQAKSLVAAGDKDKDPFTCTQSDPHVVWGLSAL